jgi:UDP-N-acetylglucosamine:LPS N-acetylglucosamine transferase
VVILSATVGQGHEGAARELARRLSLRGVTTEVHDFLDALPAVVRHTLRDGYHPTVQHAPGFFDWLFDGLEHRPWLQRVGDAVCRSAEPTVLGWTRGADVVVSTYPLASQTLGQLRRQAALVAPAVTFLTDPAAHRLWCHPAVDRHLTVTQATADDGARYGVDLQAVGPLCAPRFSRAVPRSARERLRAELALPRLAPVVLLSAGSLGLGSVPDTVDAVLRHPQAWVVVLCGRNAALRRRLASRARVVALGWRDDVAELMAAADVLVHNAGGLSFTEALVAGLPAVTYLPIPGHGRANADLLARAALAPWPRNPDELVAAIDEILARPRPVCGPRAATADPASVVAELVARRVAATRPVPRPESA